MRVKVLVHLVDLKGRVALLERHLPPSNKANEDMYVKTRSKCSRGRLKDSNHDGIYRSCVGRSRYIKEERFRRRLLLLDPPHRGVAHLQKRLYSPNCSCVCHEPVLANVVILSTTIINWYRKKDDVFPHQVPRVDAARGKVDLTVHMPVVACRKRPFFEFSLCLSRACLGKIMHFIYIWLKKCRFPYRR
eukprot:COSAG06_NODE_575_length_14056_cov_25.763345_3_plen_189_part_00